MTIMRKYQCPECNGLFTYLHHPNEDVDPVRDCPLCGYTIRDDVDNVYTQAITAPVIHKQENKSADIVYRAMENASAVRAEEAANALGVSVSDVADMKITDMKDNLREGDVAAMPTTARAPEPVAMPPVPINDPRQGSFRGSSDTAEYAKSTRTGPFAGAGMSTANMISSRHESTRASVIRNGNLGRG